MRISEAIAGYLAHREGNVKSSSALKDAACLRSVVRFFGDVEVDSIVDFEGFFFPGRWNKASYRNAHLTIIRSFLQWCRHKKIVAADHDPLFGWRALPDPARERAYVPLAEWPALLDAAPEPRDRMVIALGLYLFARQSEIATLRVGDYRPDPVRPTIGVTIEKTHQHDRMFVNPELEGELSRWLQTYRRRVPHLAPGAFLVPSRAPGYAWAPLEPGRALQRPYKAVQRTLAALGWEDDDIDGEGGHLLRRSGARGLYLALRDDHKLKTETAMDIVQHRLHHKTREMTERYIGIKVSEAEVEKVLREPVFTVPECDTPGIVIQFPRGAVIR